MNTIKYLAVGLILAVVTVHTHAQEVNSSGNLSIEQSLQLAAKHKQDGDLKEATRFLNGAALVAWETRNYPKAIELFNESIDLNKQINNASGISKLQSNLAMIYADLGEYEKALEFFQTSLDYRLKHGEKTEIISTYINKGVVLNNLKRYKDAAASIEEALRLATTMNDAAQMKSCYGMLAETYEKEGNQERTLHYFNLYRTFHEMIERNKVSEAKKETHSAQLKALQLELEKKEQHIALLNANRELALTEAELKKLDKEVRTIMENSTKQELAMEVLEREIELDELRLVEAENKTYTQRIILGVVIISLAVAVSFGVLVFRNYRYKKRINGQLRDQNEEIKTLNGNLEGVVQQRTSELRKTLTHLEKRNTDLEQFSHIISHNLRGPVANILGLGNVINRKNLADPFNGEVFDHLMLATRNLDGVVKDLSVILEVKDAENIAFDIVNLEDACQKACGLLEDEIRQTNARIETSFAGAKSLWSVKPYMESILFNLLSNAIKYRSKSSDPTIRISSSLIDNNVSLSIADNGMGIESDDLEKIFHPYKRFHLEGEGKGLGLYIVKTQVEALGGTITVKSEKNKGTSFTITLPDNRH